MQCLLSKVSANRTNLKKLDITTQNYQLTGCDITLVILGLDSAIRKSANNMKNDHRSILIDGHFSYSISGVLNVVYRFSNHEFIQFV